MGTGKFITGDTPVMDYLSIQGEVEILLGISLGRGLPYQVDRDAC